MTAEAWASVDDGAQTATRADGRWLRGVIIAAGIGWAILFVVIGVGFQLQLYGDGSIFSYSVAVDDAWAFHWHNISGRLFTYLSTLLPAAIHAALSREASAGIAIYAL